MICQASIKVLWYIVVDVVVDVVVVVAQLAKYCDDLLRRKVTDGDITGCITIFRYIEKKDEFLNVSTAYIYESLFATRADTKKHNNINKTNNRQCKF